MRNFQRKHRLRDVLQSWPALALLGVLVLFFAWGVIGLLGKMQGSRENRKLAQAKIAELQKEKTELSTEIEQLKTPEGQEASIREKFSLAKEGEGLIVVVDDKSTEAAKKEESSRWFSFLFFWNWFK